MVLESAGWLVCPVDAGFILRIGAGFDMPVHKRNVRFPQVTQARKPDSIIGVGTLRIKRWGNVYRVCSEFIRSLTVYIHKQGDIRSSEDVRS